MGNRFVVKEFPEGFFRVVDSRNGNFVDGPYLDRESAEMRAAKREIRDAEAEILGEENGAEAEVT